MLLLCAGAAIPLCGTPSRPKQLATSADGHTAAVMAVAFSPDGRLLASGGADDDPTVRLWDVRTGRPLRVLQGDGAAVVSVSFNPDGHWLASGSHDGTVRIWEVATGREDRTLIREPDWISSVVFNPDGHLLASASGGKSVGEAGKSSDWNIRLWDTRTWHEERILKGHENGVLSVTFSPDGRLLASVGEDGMLRLWDVGAGRELRQIAIHNPCSYAPAAFTPDGSKIALGDQDVMVNIWDVATGRKLETFRNPSRVCAIAISPDGGFLATAGFYQIWPFRIIIWDLRGGARSVLQPLTGHEQTVVALAFSPGGQLLASSSGDTSVILWNTRTWKPVRILGHPRPYRMIE